MAVIEFAKYVNNLPSTYAPNTAYFVKNQEGFDFYLSTQNGTNVVSLNPPSVKYVKRSGVKRIFSQITNLTLTTFTLMASRIYLIPFIPTSNITISDIGFEVTTAVSGNAYLGIYSNKLNNNNDEPDILLASIGPFSTSTTGSKSGTISFNFTKNTIYWIAIVCNAGPTIRALPVGGMAPLLGIQYGTTSSYTYFYSASSGVLPTVYNLTLTIAAGVTPAIYSTWV
jgi:hypothetical protein